MKLAGRRPLDADDGDVLTEWALAGQGIVMKPVLEIADHLRAGAAARRCCPITRPSRLTLAVLYPHRELLPAKVKVFADFAVEHIRAHVAHAVEGLPYRPPR